MPDHGFYSHLKQIFYVCYSRTMPWSTYEVIGIVFLPSYHQHAVKQHRRLSCNLLYTLVEVEKLLEVNQNKDSYSIHNTLRICTRSSCTMNTQSFSVYTIYKNAFKINQNQNFVNLINYKNILLMYDFY